MVHKNRNERPIWLPRQYWRMLTCYRRTSMIHQESRRRPNRFRHLVYIRVPTDAYYRGGRPALYQQHGVEEIARSDAGAQNLGPTTDCIAEIIERSKVARRKSIWSRNSNARLARFWTYRKRKPGDGARASRRRSRNAATGSSQFWLRRSTSRSGRRTTSSVNLSSSDCGRIWIKPAFQTSLLGFMNPAGDY